MRPKRRRRAGFTLIELLVVISIIGILVGLLLPAVNSAREAGRRAQCANNIRQLGLALINFSSTHNSFPNSGTFDESAFTGTDATKSQTYTALTTSPPSVATTWSHSWVVDIMQYLDQPDIANGWDFQSYFGATTTNNSGQPPNATLAKTALNFLRCPDDVTAQPNQPNLSYAANGGFTLFQGSPTGYIVDPSANTGKTVALSGTNVPFPATRLGVMFPGTVQGNLPWDYKTSTTGIMDGASNTILISENTQAGVDPNLSPSGWANPLPQYNTIIGSSHVCDGQTASSSTSKTCDGGVLNEVAGTGVGWIQANNKAANNLDFINNGTGLAIEGLPFSSSGHPGGCNMVFCDGAVHFIQSSINGAVYARILTPSGSKVPPAYRQLPVNQDEFAK